MEEVRLSLGSFNVQAVAGVADGAIDAFDYLDGLPALVPHLRPDRVPRGAPLIVAGWAHEPEGGEPAAEVLVVRDGSTAYPCASGIPRSATRAGKGASERAGFRSVVPTDDLTPGSHELRAYVRGPGERWYEAGQRAYRLFEPVQPALEPAQRALSMRVEQVAQITNAGRLLLGAEPIQAGSNALVVGWAIDGVLRRGVAGVAALHRDGHRWSVPCDVQRPDIAAAMGASDTQLGFELLIPSGVLGRGRHAVDVVAFDADGRRYADARTVTFDVAAPARTFPAFAQPVTPALRCGARLVRRDDPKLPAQVVPCGGTIDVTRDAAFMLEGWAVDASGAGADEVFVEIGLPEFAIPPHRHASIAGFRLDEPPNDVPRAPVPDGWFRCPFGVAELQERDYAVTLVVVDAGRRTLRRTTLCTLRVLGRGAGARA